MEQHSTTCSWLPSDLISEILLRLPAKSVGRFRCVSKLWLSITTDPRFIMSFGTIRRPSLLICTKKDHNKFDTSISSSYSTCQPFHRYPMKVPAGKHCYFSSMDSVHGLICMEDLESKKPLVWNPTTGQLLALPKPKISSRYMNVLLGYDSVEDKHKVVCLPLGKTCKVCRVFTLGTGQESWKTVKTNVKHCCDSLASGRCIKGVIYYIACNRQGYDTVVMSFDVRSEIFRMLLFPSRIHGNVLISYEGRLACFDAKNDKRLWSLEDADKKMWSLQTTRFLSCW